MFIPATELTHATITQQLAQGIAAIEAGQSVIEFNQTTTVDSSAVACLIGWQRHAQRRGVSLELKHLPNNLMHLMTLYGVVEMV